MSSTEAWQSHFAGRPTPDLTLRPRHLSFVLDEAADAAPDRMALRFQNMRMTYAELRERAERFAAALRQSGVHPGDRVAIMLPNLPQTIVAFWGVMKAGATAVMTNPLYRETELKRHFRDAGVRVLITLDLLWQHIAPLMGTLGLDRVVVTDVGDALRPPLPPRAGTKEGSTDLSALPVICTLPRLVLNKTAVYFVEFVISI